MRPRFRPTEIVVLTALMLPPAGVTAQDRVVRVDTAIPFATGASEGRIEPTSALSWDRYQAGRVGDWWYRIDPDGAAVFARDPSLSDGRVLVRCGETACQQRSTPAGVATPITAAAPLDPADPLPGYAAWVLSGAALGREAAPATPAADTEPADACPAGPPETASRAEPPPAPPPVPLTDRDQIRSLQAGLAVLGLDPGAPDGLPGPRTDRALTAFRATTPADRTGPPTRTDLAAVLAAVNRLLITASADDPTDEDRTR